MTKPYRLRYHPGATDDLYRIFTLIEDYAGTEIAERKLMEIERATKSLIDFPYKGSLRSEVHSGLRVIPAGEKAVICFTIDEADYSVFILTIGYAVRIGYPELMRGAEALPTHPRASRDTRPSPDP